MAQIRPFRGLRFGPAAGPLADLVAPPYDVLSGQERNELAARNPHNVVHLTLPEAKPDDRSKFVKYQRSATALAEWRRVGTLAAEQSPSLYRYIQTFTIPGVAEPLVRTALIALIKTEPYEKGVVLPHEQTFPKHKEDRLRILEATYAHLECIFGLVEDDDGALHQAVVAAPAAERVEVTTEDGVHHVLEPVSDPTAVAALVDGLGPKKVWIADGHHRYETACTFRANLGDRDGLVAEDFMMMALTSIADPGLVLLPTHRILKSLPLPAEQLKARLADRGWTVRDVANAELMVNIESDARQGLQSLAVALPGGQGFVFARPASAAGKAPGEGSERLRALDVSVLHQEIFAEILGLQGLDFFGYTRIEQEALEAVETGSPAAFLMNPPTVADMKDIAVGGEKMPQKSTYYYPKILSGLVLWSLKDFAE